MKLRGFIVSLLLTLFAIGAACAGWVGMQQWSERTRTVTASRLIALADSLYVLSDAVLQERAFSVVRTSVNVVATPPQLRELEEFGQETDAALRRVLYALAALDDPALDATRRALEGLPPRVAEVRPAVLAAARLPLADRQIPDALRPASVYDAVARQLDAARATTHALTQRNDAQLGTLLSVASGVWDLRLATTRAILPLSTAIRSGRPMTAAEVETATSGEAVKLAHWESLRATVALLGAPSRLAAGLAEVQLRFWDDANRRIAELVAAGRAGTPYPMSIADYSAFGPTASRLPVVLRDAALAEARAVAEARQAGALRRLMLVLAAIVACGLAMATGVWLLLRRVVRPVEALTATVGRLAQGDHDVTIPVRDRRDEIGSMAGALEVLRRNALAARQLAEAAAAAQAAKMGEVERSQALIRDFEASVGSVLAALEQATAPLDGTADMLGRRAAATEASASTISDAAGKAESHVDTVAAASEQLVASIADVARQVGASADLARRAAENARAGDGVVTGLQHVTERIGSFTGLIASIASQTNLLALNATIEAARAGESGKGFAVVAGEVKTLAAQTARATEEISGQIAAMQSETHRAVDTMRAIGAVVEELSDIAARVAIAAEEQVAAVRDISRAVGAASGSTSAVAQHSASMLDEAGAAASASEALRGAAQRLSCEAEALRGQVGGFLAALRAA